MKNRYIKRSGHKQYCHLSFTLVIMPDEMTLNLLTNDLTLGVVMTDEIELNIC